MVDADMFRALRVDRGTIPAFPRTTFVCSGEWTLKGEWGEDGFAGVWERWTAPDNKPVDTFAIITTDSNELAAAVHNRMLVIVEPRDYTRWLTRADEEQPKIDLLRPYDAGLMKAWTVSLDVGNVRNNAPELCAEWRCPPNSA